MTINIKNTRTINAEGTHINGNSKEVFCKTKGKFYASLSDAAHSVNGSIGSMSIALKHRNGVYKGMKWCYVSDIHEHLDDLATDIRENIEKAMAYDALMAINEKIKKEEANLAKHNEAIASLRWQIDAINSLLLHEIELASEAEARINTLKEEFWK